jgi:multidrug efflux pump subunit AcrB
LNTIRHILLLAAALALLTPVVRSEQPQKASRSTQEDRVKKLEERLDAAEKAATVAAIEKDYIERSQKEYESYYQKVLNTQMWTLGIMGLILIGVFFLVARFSLKMIEEQTKTATAGATVQMRNEYARTLAKEVQKLWDSNAADLKKLKETLTTQIEELERNLNDRSDFQMQFVQALARGANERNADSVVNFRNSLSNYKSGKPRKLIETKLGATAVRSIFESLEKTQAENYVEKAREELADPLYNGLEEELAIAALQIPWLTPLVNERRPATPEPPAPEPAAAEAPVTSPMREMLPADSDLPLDEESDSCRLITT